MIEDVHLYNYKLTDKIKVYFVCDKSQCLFTIESLELRDQEVLTSPHRQHWLYGWLTDEIFCFLLVALKNKNKVQLWSSLHNGRICIPNNKTITRIWLN